MPAIIHSRAKGDTLSEFAVQLRLGDNPYDLTGFTVKFGMVDGSGNQVLAETAANISDAAEGNVEFDFPAPAVANAGTYYGYFKIYDGINEHDTYPPQRGQLIIEIYDPTAAQPTVSNNINILEAANAPTRVRTVEGSVEERSLTELIKADQYQSSKNAIDAVPWGIRIAKTKPPSLTG